MSLSSLMFANLSIGVCQFVNDRITNEFYSHGSVSTRILTPNAYTARTDSEECGWCGAAVEYIQLGGSGQRPAEALTSRCFSLQEAFLHF